MSMKRPMTVSMIRFSFLDGFKVDLLYASFACR